MLAEELKALLALVREAVDQIEPLRAGLFQIADQGKSILARLVQPPVAFLAGIALALALFLAGSNYCLVGTVAAAFGAHVSCMAPAGSRPAAAICSRCAHSAPGSRAPAPARAGTPPCCVALAPVLAISGAKLVAGEIATAAPAAPAADQQAPLLNQWLGARDAREAGPPPLHAGAPLPARAPPLA